MLHDFKSFRLPFFFLCHKWLFIDLWGFSLLHGNHRQFQPCRAYFSLKCLKMTISFAYISLSYVFTVSRESTVSRKEVSECDKIYSNLNKSANHCCWLALLATWLADCSFPQNVLVFAPPSQELWTTSLSFLLLDLLAILSRLVSYLSHLLFGFIDKVVSLHVFERMSANWPHVSLTCCCLELCAMPV